jgi:hypothetical protein
MLTTMLVFVNFPYCCLFLLPCVSLSLIQPSWDKAIIRDLSQVDRDMSGTIDSYELMELRSKTVKLSRADKMMEILSTHPNMLKRVQHLSSLMG